MTHYKFLFTNARWWISLGNDLIGGYSANALRSYVFPLYTPAGVLVLQEAPPDHPHHQGIHTGLSIDGYDLWNAGSGARARHTQRLPGSLGELRPESDENGIQIRHPVLWTTVEGETLLHEERTIHMRRYAGANHVYWHSVFTAPNRPVQIDQTKEAGIALRVPPHWETAFGGRIRNAGGDVGEAACFDKLSPWLNIEGSAGNGRVAGVIFAPAAGSEPCPWFTRDYGEHVYNPSRHQPIKLQPGGSFTWAVDVLAYDGAVTVEQINSLLAETRQ